MNGLLRGLKTALVAALCVQLAACGTILYPERKGQRDGRLDVGVVLLDGIGLLFFIIPGVIAFAVDFSDGTIYLPEGKSGKKKASLLERGGHRTVRFDPKRYTPDSLRLLIRRETGYDLDWRDPRLQAARVRREDELPACFARAGRSSVALR